MFSGTLSVVNVVETPVVIIVSWLNFSWNLPGVSGLMVVRHVHFANFFPALEEDMDTIIVLQKLGHSPGKRVDFLLSFINPVVLNSGISLN